MSTNEYGGYSNRESLAFETWYANNHDLYVSINGYVKNLLSRVPTMTRQTIGVNVKTEVRIWIQQALMNEPIYSLGWWDRPVQINPKTLLAMASDIGLDNWNNLSEYDIADSVISALGRE